MTMHLPHGMQAELAELGFVQKGWFGDFCKRYLGHRFLAPKVSCRLTMNMANAVIHKKSVTHSNTC